MVRELLNKGHSIREIAREFGIAPTLVFNIKGRITFERSEGTNDEAPP